MSYDDLDLALSGLASPPRATHRRARSDPTDFMQSVRGERARVPGMPGKGKREKEEGGASPGPVKKRAAGVERITFGPEADAIQFDYFTGYALDELVVHPPSEPNHSKKDVPMWTVEEDLLILKLVEAHGKRWSKIASHLHGRTDNGVRNRWNRMERAQVIKGKRGAPTGYNCRRCGEPKRGHICAARTMAGEQPEGVELVAQAKTLTELSAVAIQSQSDLVPPAPAPPADAPADAPNARSAARGGARGGARAKRPSPLAIAVAAGGVEAGSSSSSSSSTSTTPRCADVGGSSVPSPSLAPAADPFGEAFLSSPLGAPFLSGNIDELSSSIEEMFEQHSLGYTPTRQADGAAPPAAAPPPPLITQASLQSALAMLVAEGQALLGPVGEQIMQPPPMSLAC